MITTNLYWHDSRLCEFTATVVEVLDQIEGCHIVLDQTAFYPESGGQPGDIGMINSVKVVDVSLDDDGRIIHWLEGTADFKPGDQVSGSVDWPRRREMTQQHTGQHILSQAFFQLFGAETKGFRITARAAEIDLTLELQPEQIAAAMERAETLANEVVFDNREVRTHIVTPEEAAQMPLRKESFITDCIRVVEIDDFDWSPCGGTHAKRTGEVGLIAVRSWERAKQMTRVHFVCGGRALRDYRAVSQTAGEVAMLFSVGRDEAVEAVQRLFEKNKQLVSRTKALAEMAVKAEARELLESIEAVQGWRIVSRIFDDRDLDEIKLLAHRLVAHDSVIALLATRDHENARLVFACSADADRDLNALLRKACEQLGGRGGGKPDFAQGGGPKVDELERVMASSREALQV